MKTLIRTNLHLMMSSRRYRTIKKHSLYESEHGEEKVAVLYHEVKINIDEMKRILINLKDSDVRHVVLVTAQPPTPDAMKNIAECRVFRFEIFQFAELLFPLLSCVPRHEVVAAEDEIPKNIARILTSDPLVRYHLWRPGTILRSGGGGGELVSYRIVCNN